VSWSPPYHTHANPPAQFLGHPVRLIWRQATKNRPLTEWFRKRPAGTDADCSVIVLQTRPVGISQNFMQTTYRQGNTQKQGEVDKSA
jgi:hypothetical protein